MTRTTNMLNLEVNLGCIFLTKFALSCLLFGTIFSSNLQAQVQTGHLQQLVGVERNHVGFNTANFLPMSFSNNPTIDESPSELSLYENTQYGLGIQYPSDWSYQEYDPSPDLVAFNVVSFFPPISQDPDLASELRLTIENLNTPMSLDEYSRDSVNYYRNNSENFSLNSLTTTEETLSGEPAYEIFFSEDVNGVEHTSYEKGTIDYDKGRVYYVTFTSPTPTFDQLFTVAENTIDTLTLEQPGAFSEDEQREGLSSLLPSDSFSGLSEIQGPPEDLDAQDLEFFLNSFGNSIFNGSSTFATFGSSVVSGIKVIGMNLSEEDTGENGGAAPIKEQLSVTLSGSATAQQTSSGNSSVTVVAVRIPIDMKNMLSPQGLLGLAAAAESSGNGIPPVMGGGVDDSMGAFGQESSVNPFGFLSEFQIGSSTLVNPDWSEPQTVSMSLLGKPESLNGTTTTTPTLQSSNPSSSLDIVFAIVVPYTGAQ